jgi:hypothetical protein
VETGSIPFRNLQKQTTTTTTTTATTTTIYNSLNVDCVEQQDECTAACQPAASRNYALLTPSEVNGRACIGPTDCQPGEGECPTTTSTSTIVPRTKVAGSLPEAPTDTTNTTTSTANTDDAGEGEASDDITAPTLAADEATNPLSATPDPDASTEQSNGSTIAGVVVGVLVLLALIVVGLIMYRRSAGGAATNKNKATAITNAVFEGHYSIPNMPQAGGAAANTDAAAENNRGFDNPQYPTMQAAADSDDADDAGEDGQDGAQPVVYAEYSDNVAAAAPAPAPAAAVVTGSVVYDQTYSAAEEVDYNTLPASDNTDMYAVVDKQAGIRAAGAIAAEGLYNMPAPGAKQSTRADVDAAAEAAAAIAAAASSAATEPQYVARDAMGSEPAMYDVAPADDAHVPRPTMQGGSATTTNQVRARVGTGSTGSTVSGQGKRRSTALAANQCARPSPTGGTCKNAKVNGSFCKGHSCRHSGCTESKSSSETFCAAHVKGGGRKGGGGGGGGGRGRGSAPAKDQVVYTDLTNNNGGAPAEPVMYAVLDQHTAAGDGAPTPTVGGGRSKFVRKASVYNGFEGGDDDNDLDC